MSTVPSKDLSEEIVKTQFRDRLRTEAAASGEDLNDPKSGSRTTDDPEFVLTAFPDDNPFYPHIIVSESGDAGNRLGHSPMFQHNYAVEAAILALSSTNMFSIRDGVRHWFERNIDTLGNNGFQDGEVISSSRMNWEPDPKVTSWQVTFGGTVITENQ